MKSIDAGSRFGPYEILSPLGAGGMGEVYRARDVNLGREVAVKVLPEAFASDPERVARFEREARVLASLNHPNIATIHGLERAGAQSFLIMEFVAGETLASRIARGPVPVDAALPLAAQIAAALEAAHEKGVVHRDLKPANIAVTPDGKVKVLDFGLAKLGAGGAGAQDLSDSPTMAAAPSSTGLILGTAAYMSPEQARGKAIDKRADIWAFGCVLFEMLTGKAAFAGETLTDIVAAVVKNEPEWAALPADTPTAIRTLLRRCLKKDPAQRLHDAADARIELEEALAEPAARSQGVYAPLSRSSFASRVAWVLVALLATALVVMLIFLGRPEPPGPRVVRLELNMPTGVEVGVSASPNMVVSPDGSKLAFVGGMAGVRRIYLRRFDEFESTALRGTDTAMVCVFSPDGTSLAFISSDRNLRRVSLADGLITTITPNADDVAGGLAWSGDDHIVFARAGTLWQVSAAGSPPEQLTSLSPQASEQLHLWPFSVPNSNAVLFTTVSGTERVTTRIEALLLDTKQRRVVIDDGRYPIYSASGHLLFLRSDALISAPFDATKLEVTGPPVAVLDDVSLDQTGAPLVMISGGGALAYNARANATKRLVWVSRQGVEQPISDVSRPYQNPRLSPDSRRIVVEVSGDDLWIQDATRATFTRLTTPVTLGNTFPVWTPDARSILFRTLTGIHKVDADGSGSPQAVPGTVLADVPTSVSPDGRTLAFIHRSQETGGDMYVMSLQGDPRPNPVVATGSYDGGGQFSPDGRWMAYVSNESGRYEVYLRPFPGPDRKIPVSTEGGIHPKWNPNGKELFYRSGNKMMVVDASTTQELRLSRPRVLFEQRYAFGTAQTVANYDISPDGQRFLMVKDEAASGRINIVLNWFEELKRLAPTQAR